MPLQNWSTPLRLDQVKGRVSYLVNDLQVPRDYLEHVITKVYKKAKDDEGKEILKLDDVIRIGKKIMQKIGNPSEKAKFIKVIEKLEKFK